ncbi:MAG: TolC family protein [Deltaproteobacteria bacterium]|nr:TolC family protein [Deltaproteobacteria bacterium]
MFQKQTKLIALLWGLAHLSLAVPVLGKGSDHESRTRAGLREAERAFSPAMRNDSSNKPAFQGHIDEYVAYAMNRSPNLRASFERWRALVHGISRARRLPDPRITYGYFLLSVETRVGPQRHRVGLKQTFPWPTKLTAGADARAARARAAQHLFDAETSRVRARVAEAYWDLWLVRETLTVRKELLDISISSAETVRARLVVGEASLSDQQQIDLFIARLEDSIAGLELDEASASSRLTAAVGAPPGIRTPTIDSHPHESLPGDTIEELRRLALDHPLLASFELQAEGADSDARSARAERLPSFTIGVDWIEVGEASMSGVEDSGRDALVVGAGITLPLWQRNYKEGVEAHKAEAAAYRWNGRAAADQSLSTLERAFSAVFDSHRRIRLHRGTLVPQALAALDSVLGSYTVSRAGVAQVLMAQRELLELKIVLARANAGHQIAWARLEETVGHPIRFRAAESGASR